MAKIHHSRVNYFANVQIGFPFQVEQGFGDKTYTVEITHAHAHIENGHFTLTGSGPKVLKSGALGKVNRTVYGLKPGDFNRRDVEDILADAIEEATAFLDVHYDTTTKGRTPTRAVAAPDPAGEEFYYFVDATNDGVHQWVWVPVGKGYWTCVSDSEDFPIADEIDGALEGKNGPSAFRGFDTGIEALISSFGVKA